MKLDERLQVIADFIPKGARVADIGTDQAYLPIFLIKQGYVAELIAGEVNSGPYKAAIANITKMQLSEKITLRFGDGLSILQPGEADTVVMAGMGGTTIINILELCPKVTAALECLILQPMVAAAKLRRWLAENSWQITDEALVVAENKIYEIIKAERNFAKKPCLLEDIEYEIGPVLLNKKPPQLKLKLKQLLAKTNNVLAAMKSGKQLHNPEKYYMLTLKLQQLEELLKCL